MPDVILTVGIPASGKSTWAREYALDEGAVIVCRDDIRATYGFNYQMPKDKIAENEQFVSKVQRLQIEAALMDGRDVVVADTNLNPKFRKDLIKFAHEHRANVIVVPFDIGLDEAITRDNNREAKVGADVVQRFYNQFREQGWHNRPEGELHEAPYATDYKHNGRQKIVVFDIDGTVARHVNRSPYDESKVYDDEPIKDVIEIAQTFVASEDIGVVFVSGRKDSCIRDTCRWLNEKAGFGYLDFELYMRKHNDNRPDYLVKNEIYDQHLIPNYDIVMVFDDRDQVVRHLRARGITVAQVAPGRF